MIGGVTLSLGAGVDLTPNARAPLAAWALPLQRRGVFARMGRGPVEFDCMGIVTWVQAEIGRAVRSYEELYRDLDITNTGAVDELVRAEVNAWCNVAAGGVGDVLVLGHGKRAHHVAVLCGAGRALHALEGSGIVIGEIEGRARVRRFAGMGVFGCVAPN